jgi:Ca2+-binding RTX toxin-like protein
MKWLSKLLRPLTSGHVQRGRGRRACRDQSCEMRFHTNQYVRNVKMSFDTLEDRISPAILAHSLYPDSIGPQGAQFGFATATDASFHVVGMPLADIGNVQNSGAAYVYSASSGALVATLDNPNPARLAYFGWSVAVSGNTVVVGSYTAGQKAYVFNATTGALVATLSNPSPDPFGDFGYSVAVSGSSVVVGAPHNDVGASANCGQAYVFDASTGALIATLDNPSPATNDDFGNSVSVSGNTVVVGAYQDDAGGFNSGRAYVFDASTGALLSTLANPSPASGDQFGGAVSVSGEAVVVGAISDDTGATDNGQAYVFNATTGALMFSLTDSFPGYADGFGGSVSVSANTVVVGAYGDSTAAEFAGRAYVFDATTGALITTLDNPASGTFDFFGNSVSVSGNTVVVGACGDGSEFADSVTQRGQVYVFNATTGALIGPLDNPSPATEDRFGRSVSVSGNTIVVGAPFDSTEAKWNGQAYLFDVTTGAQTASLVNPSPAIFDGFGESVSVSGNTVVVGAPRDDTDATDSGQAYLFNATTGALFATLPNPSPSNGDLFGQSVSVSGNTVVVGAVNSGQAYVFDATTGALIATLDNPSPMEGDMFGISVSVSGNTVVVGASGADTGSGLAYVFDATTEVLIAALANPSPAYDYSYYDEILESNVYVPGDRFGTSVSVSGNTVVVGANLDDTAATDSGQAYVFDATTGALTATLTNIIPTGDEQFGYTVSVSGGTVVVGSPYNEGRAVVFNAGTSVPLINPNPPPTSFNDFGWSVSVSGNTVVVGAAGDSTQNFVQGAAFVYTIDAPSDSDEDGIANAVDTSPAIFSDDFSDGVTTGTIVSRGDQTLTIVDAPDTMEGVFIAADPSGGSIPATISIDGGASTLTLQAGDQVIVTHGSVILHVVAGTVEATFVADSGQTATASLDSGNGVVFKPDTFTFTAPAANAEIVQVNFVADSGQTSTVGLVSENSVTFQPATGTFIAPATNTQPIEVVSNGGVVTVNPGETIGVQINAGILQFGGGAGVDVVTVNSGKLVVNGTAYSLSGVTEVHISGRDGNDRIDLSGLSIKSFIDGGKGNDQLTGGSGDDVILGGADDDTITGGAGNDFLAGGSGADRIVGSAGNDILTAGDIGSGLDLAALRAISQAWAASRSVGDSTVDDYLDTTVFTDAAVDQMTGSSGADLFIIISGDKITDYHFGKPQANKDSDVVVRDGAVVI